jgi:alkylation response protein AidB-like acyl-CoA dehydrogenase
MAQPRDFGFGPDEALIRDQARKFLADHVSVAKLRKLVGHDHDAVYVRGEPTGYDEAVWKKCVELGWTGLAVPEAQGGVGAKAVAVAALVEEVGRHAFPSPLVPTLIATYVLRACNSEAANALLARVAEGETLSLAITNEDGDWLLDGSEVTAEPVGAGFVLRGISYFVQDAFKVDGLLVAARAPDGLALFVVPRSAANVSLFRDQIVDLTRDQARVVLDGVEVAAAQRVSLPGQALSALATAWPMALTLVSADLVGSSEWLLSATVEYAKVRKQFDHPIGFFQAVKHPLVNAMMDVDRARSHVYNAACAADTEPQQAETYARMAKSAASDAAGFVADRSVQLHGGIGFTWECDVHLFFKRARHNMALYGDGVHQRKRLAEVFLGPLSS